ncbi:Uncharacterised protein [uncultured archaeon]|nr:Uncharacterised protein [uncultured archaeon]
MSAARQMRWKDFRFHFFDRNPQLFAAFELSLEELQTMVFDFSNRKKYDLSQHALNELHKLLSAYIIARSDSLRIPSATMAVFLPSERRFDSVLTRQLERLKAHATRGVSNSDQEFVKEVVSTLGGLSLTSLKSRSYFDRAGENSVATLIAGYLNGSIQEAAVRKLDDVALDGADHLRDLCKALIENALYSAAIGVANDLEKLATMSILSTNDIVLNAAVRALADCLLHNCIHGHAGTHVGTHLLESLFRITGERLASPLSLDMTKVSYSIGPFVSPTEHSSFAAINIGMVNGIAEFSRSGQHEDATRLMSLYEELHKRSWLDFAELGIEAVKKNSFLLHYINSSIEETVKAHFWLLHALKDLPRIEERGPGTVSAQYYRDRFRDELESKIRWETTGVYSRIIPAMFEHKQLSYLNDTVEMQVLFAFWAMRAHVENVAGEASSRIFKACERLQDPQYKDFYGSARLAIHIAQIGIYAIAVDDQQIYKTATEQYSTLRRTFLERYPDTRFVGDFESAKRELLEDRWRGPHFDEHEREFFSTVAPEQIENFFSNLE